MPHGSGNPTSAMAEPLMDVLGRYKAWASTQRSARVGAVERLDPGARELSYEDALKANRYPGSRPLPDSKLHHPATTNPDPAIEHEHRSSPPNGKKQPVRAQPGQSRTKAKAREAARVPKATPTRKRARPQKADHPTRAPEFRDVLDRTVALSNSAHASVRPEKSVWLSLRVSASEQAVVQARAAEAGLSVSAYLRQCAFEVESLRDQVKRALAELRAPALPSDKQATAQPSTPGVLGGLLRKAARLFSREARFSATA